MLQEFSIGGSNYRIEDGFTEVSISPDTNLTLETAKAVSAKIKEILGDKKNLVFADLTGLKSVSRDARAYYANDEGGYNTKAVAMLATSPVTRVLGNFFAKLSKPGYPIRLVNSREEGLAWLEQFKE